MMTDKVKNNFKDKEDNGRLCEVGQNYPREGLEVSEERLELLRSEHPKWGKVFIGKVANDAENEEEFPFHKGGGNYILSNGESVKGKEAAIEAENELKSGE